MIAPNLGTLSALAAIGANFFSSSMATDVAIRVEVEETVEDQPASAQDQSSIETYGAIVMSLTLVLYFYNFIQWGHCMISKLGVGVYQS